MKILNSKIAYKGKYLKVIEKEFLDKNGKKEIWECVKRKDAVFIFALTKKKEVILEKIFRVPVNSFVISLPAGTIDKKRDKPQNVARRELLEETGYLAEKLIPFLKFPPNPGVLMEKGILFFVSEVEYTGKRKTEDTEEIEVLKIPLKKLENFLIKQAKYFKIDIKIWGAINILRKKNLI